jgi:Ca2+/H+ antiporter, TMEM165/GDT1 family
MYSDFAHRATKKIVGFIIMVVIFLPLAIFVFGEIVFHLWNWLVPGLFHLGALASLWQAFGLMVLSWILFGGLRGAGRWRSGRGGHWRDRMRDGMSDRWEQMTPEERDKFREWVRTRCGPASPSPASGAPPAP